jgi:hypothetical protein
MQALWHHAEAEEKTDMNIWRAFALLELMKRIRNEDPDLWLRIVAFARGNRLGKG